MKRKILNILPEFIVIYIIKFFLKKKISKLNKHSLKKKKILIFSHYRWKEDVNSLLETKKFDFFSVDVDFIQRMNAFLDQKNEKIKERIYIKVIYYIINSYNIECCLTCNFAYKSEENWIKYFELCRIPFVAIHKEYTIIDENLINTYASSIKEIRSKFKGTAIFVVSENAKKIIVKSGLAEKNKISVTGLLRSDNLFKKRKEKKQAITLFSFGHLTGPFTQKLETKHYYFCKYDKQGFVKLFNNVHYIFMKLSRIFPKINFYIQPKYYEDGWIGEINKISLNKFGHGLNKFENLYIVKNPAQEMMRKSLLNICFNSTVVLESRIMGEATLIPLFDEAKSNCKEILFFKKYFKLFFTAKSHLEFEKIIKNVIQKKIKQPGTTHQIRSMSNYYFGNVDGDVKKRVANNLEKLLTKK